MVVRRAEGPVLKGLWELPQTSLDARGRADLRSELLARHGLSIEVGDLLAVVRHAITIRRIRVEVYSAELSRAVAADPGRIEWRTRAEIATLPTSSLTGKILRALAAGQRPLDLS